MKISARNVIPGKVVSLKKGPVSSLVVIEIAPGLRLTSSVTSTAIAELKLKKGSAAYAVIKSSSVMLGID